MSIHRRSRKATRQSSQANARTRLTFYHRTFRFESLEDRRMLANVTVTTLTDSIDFNDGKTSLREAIFATNTVPGADTIDFAPAQTANGAATILLTHGELKIADTLTITGPGAALLSIDASGSDPTPGVSDLKGTSIFNINDQNWNAQFIVSVSGMRITGGDQDTGAITSAEDLRLADVIVERNTGANYIVGTGKLTVDRSHIVSNTLVGTHGRNSAITANGLAVRDSEISDNAGSGIDAGGADVFIWGTTIANNAGTGVALWGKNAEVTNSTISGNVSEYGGLWCRDRTLTSLLIEGCTIVDNVGAYPLGGGGAFVQMRSGTAVIKDSSFLNNRGIWGGGMMLSGSAQIVNCQFRGNAASYGNGGGLAVGFSSNGAIDISETTFRENTAIGSGGAISADIGSNGVLNLTDVSVIENTGHGDGGGIAILGGWQAVIQRSTIEENHTHGDGGGALVSGQSLLRVEDSTLAQNTADHFGGALAFRNGKDATISQATISQNSAGIDGGGIMFGGISNTIANSTISLNSSPRAGGISVNNASNLVMSHTIVAGNMLVSGAHDFNAATGTPNVSFSLIGSNAGNGLTPAPVGSPDSHGNLIGDSTTGSLIDPKLGPLADNGGPTKTHALLAGSPAINSGDLSAVAGANGVPLYDQRGEPYGRVFNGRIDIGAFEYQQASDLNLVVDTLSDESDGNHSHGNLSLREAVQLANTYPSNDTIRFDPALTAGGPAAILLTHGDLKISSSVTIIGAGADLLTIDASGNDPTPSVNDGKGSRVFNIDDGKSFSNSDVTLVALTLTGGDVSAGGAILSLENLNLVDSAVSGNCALVGGGVYLGRLPSRGGNLTLTRSVIQNNSASDRGGGIFANSSASALTILDSQFLENTAGGDGGGLYCSGTVTITRSVIQNNSAGRSGGGVHTNLPTYVLTIFDSQFLDNIAERDGGGIYSNGFLGEVAVTDSVFSKNRAGGDGGGMLVTGGVTTINSTSVRDNYAGRSGGGVAAWGSVIISDSSIVGNSANGGGPSAGVQGGGGISAGSFVITNTTISGNSSKGLGGGIFGAGDITDCTITNNSAGSSGGGIQAGIGKLTVSHSAIGNNLAVGGGGISSSGALIVVDSAISGNAANGSPGSLYLRNGGGIWCNGKLSVASTTISGNSSKYDGGGIWAGAKANVTITDSTISENLASVGAGFWLTSSATISLSTVARNNAQILGGGLFVQDGTLQLQNSIVSENRSSAGPDVTGLIGTTIAARYSLIGWNASSGLVEAPVGFPDANGNLIGGPLHGAIYAGLGNLSDNGGIILPDGSPIFTIPLGLGSPAINAGDPAALAGVSGVPVHDQRGVQFIRVYGERLDIGAFESQPADRILGDFNRDGMVDSSDYVLYRKQLGQTVPAGTGADANGDGVVNDADYLVWKANFGVLHSELPREAVASSAVVLGEEITVTPADQPVMLPQPEPPHDLGPQSVVPKATSFWSRHQQRTVQKQGHVLLRPSSLSQIAVDAHRLDLAIEAWSGFDRAVKRGRVNFGDERRDAADCMQSESEEETPLARAIDAAFTAL